MNRFNFQNHLGIFATTIALLSGFAHASVYQRDCLDLLKIDSETRAWRQEQKDQWRRVDKVLAAVGVERRVKIKTNIQRRRGQMGGMDESADAAAPFVMKASDGMPPGMKEGTYWLNSGRFGFYSKTIIEGNRGGPRATDRFEIVYMHKTPDGRVVTQQGGYAAPDSSWGWDGRFEIQPKADGTSEIVITQGAMELPSKMIGAGPDAKDLPEVSIHNYSRSRHVFKPLEFKDGKLYVMDEGSILNSRPSVSGDWITFEKSIDSNGKPIQLWQSSHGYGENFFPDASDPRKLWRDKDGYPIRVFDMVVEEAHFSRPDGSLKKVPHRTISVAFRMDPKNPSKIVRRGTKLSDGSPADEGIEIINEFLGGGKTAKSSVRMSDVTDNDLLVEHRVLNMDRTVSVSTYKKDIGPPTLLEGFNPVPGVVELPSGKRYYLGTFSASEYTAGGIVAGRKKEWRYGSYLGFRPESGGPLGRYTIAKEIKNGVEDFRDVLEDFTELYGLGWGAGRPQAYQDELKNWWMDVHAVDTDILKEGLPKSGYPKKHSDFADGYRRHKIAVPIKWTEHNGVPSFEIDDPEVEAALSKYRKRKTLREKRKS